MSIKTTPPTATGLQLIAASCLSLIGMASPVLSQITENSIGDVVRVSLLPGWRDTPTRHIAAISIELAPGWKTYWRSPGDGGLPTHLDWTGSENLAGAEIAWPHPKVFRDFGLRSIGYLDDVVLPLILSAQQQGDITLDLTMRFGICEEVCIPVELTFDSVLSAQLSELDPQIEQALSQQPTPANEFGITEVYCTLSEQGTSHELSVWFQSAELPGHGETLVIEAPHPGIWTSEPDFERDGFDIRASATLDIDPQYEDGDDLSKMRFTLITTTTSVEKIGCQPG